MQAILQLLEIQKEYKVGVGVCVTNTIVVYLMFLGVLMIDINDIRRTVSQGVNNIFNEVIEWFSQHK
ncbi:hypothetical protein ASQ44_01625 [Rickettsia rhipicephali]|uniref:Uncharacterized protein n=1 Tax=Rickettsia rhipicephali (strain 3-7-female6-CWPP) TaxID=1105113 RepID=A0AAI8AAT0_RICR3|nr:hypothetical protein MCC_06790 [Rickettsia rhipicephali str. 3-7-female6-CWPP]ALN40944.1 hypothetical protein ASQ44_01625 [Rickettsia rhipicephali]